MRRRSLAPDPLRDASPAAVADALAWRGRVRGGSRTQTLPARQHGDGWPTDEEVAADIRSVQCHYTWNLVASTKTNGTSSGIDTTGANLLVAVLSSAQVGYNISDSVGGHSNTWTALATYNDPSGSQTTILYVENPPYVGSGHTFATTSAFPGLYITAWSGAATTSVLDQTNGSTGTVTQPGSITPTNAGELIICGLSGNLSGTVTIDSSYTITGQYPLTGGVCYGGALAYLIQGSPTATNPTWSQGGATGIASFVAGGGGGGGPAAGTRAARQTLIGSGIY